MQDVEKLAKQCANGAINDYEKMSTTTGARAVTRTHCCLKAFWKWEAYDVYSKLFPVEQSIATSFDRLLQIATCVQQGAGRNGKGVVAAPCVLAKFQWVADR